MFHFPEAKRVRREDLNEPDDFEDNDSEAQAQLQAQFEAQMGRSLILNFEPPNTESQQQSSTKGGTEVFSAGNDKHKEKSEEEEDPEPEEYEFCLFGGSEAVSTKVILEDDNEPEKEGGFLHPRPVTLCKAPELSSDQKKMLKVAAVTGDEVLARSSWRWYANQLPWKVTHITVTRKPTSKPRGGSLDTMTRQRPNKKRRIAQRTKDRARKQDEEARAREQEEVAKQQEEKEEQLKEKKRRLNKAKQLKRRAQEKEKKLAAQGENDGGHVDA